MRCAAHERNAIGATFEEIQHGGYRIAHSIGVGARIEQSNGIGRALRDDQRTRVAFSAEAASCDGHLVRIGHGKSRPRSATLLVLD